MMTAPGDLLRARVTGATFRRWSVGRVYKAEDATLVVVVCESPHVFE